MEEYWANKVENHSLILDSIRLTFPLLFFGTILKYHRHYYCQIAVLLKLSS